MKLKTREIKEYKRGKQIVRAHNRIYQKDTFSAGYKKACEIILRKFENINLEEKEHYWKWQFMGRFLYDLLEIKKLKSEDKK